MKKPPREPDGRFTTQGREISYWNFDDHKAYSCIMKNGEDILIGFIKKESNESEEEYLRKAIIRADAGRPSAYESIQK